MDECVVDASVAIKLVLVEPLVDRARALFARLYDSPPLRMYAPDLLYVERANILWKRVRFHGYDPTLAVRDLAALQAPGSADRQCPNPHVGGYCACSRHQVGHQCVRRLLCGPCRRTRLHTRHG